MDIRSIKVQHGHYNTKTGKVIIDLCDEIYRLKRLVRIQQHILTQVVQLNKRERRRQKRNIAA